MPAKPNRISELPSLLADAVVDWAGGVQNAEVYYSNLTAERLAELASDALYDARAKVDELDRWVYAPPDVYECADCGKTFEESHERDEHFMSPACPKHGPTL
jgi:hypothetical protein